MIDKLKTWIKKQTHAERVGKKNTRLKKIRDGNSRKMNKKQKQKQKKKKEKKKKKRKGNRNRKEIK